MKKILLGLLSFILIGTFISCSEDSTGPSEPVDFVGQIIELVNSDSLYSYVASLSGEVPVNIGGTTYVIESRNRYFEGNYIAADYIEQKLEAYGLTVYNQMFDELGRNVIGVKQGTTSPNTKYIICAHYDSMPIGADAPGADDNASGVAAVLEAARILAGYNFGYTVEFALWDEEEFGLIGARYYATQAVVNNIEIAGVINLDMISYETDGNWTIKIQVNADGSGDFISDKMIEVNSAYSLQLIPDILHYTASSDHHAFAERGIPASMIIEDFDNDWNANYHQPQDLLSNINMGYFDANTKLAIGTLADLIDISSR